MSGNNVCVLANKKRIREAKSPDTAGDFRTWAGLCVLALRAEG